MSNLNYNILIRNIKTLMENNHTTQLMLANALGMSQSNVSKALSESDKKNFTLEQVIGISQFFHVSIDTLVGNAQAKRAETNPKITAEFIAQLLENHRALLTVKALEEDQFVVSEIDPYSGATHKKGTEEYLCLYFPNYWPLPEVDPNDEVHMEYYNCGNYTPSSFAINLFLHQFKEIFNIYENGNLSEETYKTVLQDLLSHLPEK